MLSFGNRCKQTKNLKNRVKLVFFYSRDLAVFYEIVHAAMCIVYLSDEDSRSRFKSQPPSLTNGPSYAKVSIIDTESHKICGNLFPGGERSQPNRTKPYTVIISWRWHCPLPPKFHLPSRKELINTRAEPCLLCGGG